MTAPPARNTLSGTPTNAQFNAGIGALYDYTVGLLGASGTPAAARAALDAVGLTGDQTIGGTKTFTGNVGIGLTPNAWGTTVRAMQVSGAALSRNDNIDANLVLSNNVYRNNANQWFYMANGFAAAMYQQGFTIGDHQWYVAGSGNANTPVSFTQAMTLDNAGTLTVTGNITAGGQFIGNGAGLTNIAAAQLTGDVAAARITNALNASGSAPIYACRAWVNFNGTGTVAIRASGNVSSITDNGVGDYTVNFTTAMPDANYSVVASAAAGDGVEDFNQGVIAPRRAGGQSNLAIGSVRIDAALRTQVAGAGTDMNHVSVAIFR